MGIQIKIFFSSFEDGTAKSFWRIHLIASNSLPLQLSASIEFLLFKRDADHRDFFKGEESQGYETLMQVSWDGFEKNLRNIVTASKTQIRHYLKVVA